MLIATKAGEIRSDWVPAAGILFQPANGKGGVGLQFWLRDPKIVSFGVHTLGNSNPREIGHLPLGEEIMFQISLNKDGIMKISVNNDNYQFKDVAVDPIHPILMCSGGSFLFTKMHVTLGS